jgi:hypothetical protein
MYAIKVLLFSVTQQQPNAAQGHLILEVSESHKMTQQSRQDSSGRVIGPSQRPLPDNTHNIHKS